MQENELKKEKYFRVIAILLIIIILILLFFSKFGELNHYGIPTGNVDVFDIDINCKCKKNADQSETDLVDGKDMLTGNLGIFDEKKDYKTLGTVFVDDKNGNYIYQQNLKIFNNSAFQYTNKIAPGVSNTYHFVVHNSSDMNLKYYIEMYEESEYQVNLKYRLKRNNSYVIGDNKTWVTASELKTAFEYISFSSSDNYSLDWKWFDNDDEKDTLAGENMTSLYKLNIRFYFEAVDA